MSSTGLDDLNKGPSPASSGIFSIAAAYPACASAPGVVVVPRAEGAPVDGDDAPAAAVLRNVGELNSEAAVTAPMFHELAHGCHRALLRRLSYAIFRRLLAPW